MTYVTSPFDNWRGYPMMAPQGWQCPVCRKVYSPTTPMCFTCGGNTGGYSTSTAGTKENK